MVDPARNMSEEHIGTVEAYVLARVAPEPGAQVTCSAVFEDYRSWCARETLIPLREVEFVGAFEQVAREAGIPLRQRGGNLSFLDMALRDVRAGGHVRT